MSYVCTFYMGVCVYIIYVYRFHIYILKCRRSILAKRVFVLFLNISARFSLYCAFFVVFSLRKRMVNVKECY